MGDREANLAPLGVAPMFGALQLKLEAFEGPLDLLLHLVREHKLDIFDIPIAFITDRYLEAIEQMKELDLDLAGEYLLMAATLAHIKSRMLLPTPELQDDEVEPGDPRNDLVARLLEYQKYRDAAEALGSQDLLGRDVFVREARPDPVSREEGDLGLREVSVFRLIESLDVVLRRARPEIQHEVLLDRVSVSDRITAMVQLLRRENRVTFRSLFDASSGRHLIIATFLALLEMSRLGLSRIFQEVLDGDILVAAAPGLTEVDPHSIQEELR